MKVTIICVGKLKEKYWRDAIAEYSKRLSRYMNLEIIELEAAQLARSLQDVDIAVINGNYAIEAGLNASSDALAKEEKDSLAATTYANILVVKEGNEKNEGVQALAKALQSDEVRTFIDETYQGAVVAMF